MSSAADPRAPMHRRVDLHDPSRFQALVINLDSRPDRMAEFETRTRAFTFPVERFSALTPSDVIERGISSSDNPIVACTASHLAVFQLVIDRQLEWALVLEDDLLPVIGFERRLNWVFEQLPDDAWLVQLGHIGRVGKTWRRRARALAGHLAPRANRLERSPFGWGTHCYLVNRSLAEFMVGRTMTNQGADLLLGRLGSETELGEHSYVHHPKLAVQAISASDIGSGGAQPHAKPERYRFLP